MKTHYYTLAQTKTGKPFLKIEKSINGKFILRERKDLGEFAKKQIYSPMPAEEMVYMLAFDSKQKLKGIFSVSHGTMNSALASPREILMRALLCGAVSIIIIHNHPSGDTEMSSQDLDVYNRMVMACSYVGIKLLDFLVVGEKITFKDEKGIITF